MSHKAICKSIANWWRLFQVHHLAISGSVSWKKSRTVCLMVHKFGRRSKINSSPGLSQTLRRLLGYHSKTSSRIFLEIHVKVITQKLFRNYWRATKCLVTLLVLGYIICVVILQCRCTYDGWLLLDHQTQYSWSWKLQKEL